MKRFGRMARLMTGAVLCSGLALAEYALHIDPGATPVRTLSSGPLIGIFAIASEAVSTSLNSVNAEPFSIMLMGTVLLGCVALARRRTT